MIKIQNISIKNFRGIKELTIPFQGKSWVIHGRNGSGKSGVVDALEFALAGEIGRLSGEGRGDVSVKVHGPHVDFKDSPKTANVVADISIAGVKDTLKITRDCSTPNKSKYTPAKGDAVDKYTSYPIGKELVLSRREILKFILSEPGKRSKEVQALLKINKIDEIRSAFQTLKNKVERLTASERQEFDRNKEKLKDWLSVEEINKDTILKVINQHRATLNLQELLDLEEKISIVEGQVSKTDKKNFVNKIELIKDAAALQVYLKENLPKHNQSVQSFKSSYSSISEKKDEVKKLSKLAFYQMGISLVDENECPFCETTWNQEELQEIVKTKIESISGLKATQVKLREGVTDIHSRLKNIKIEFSDLKEKMAKIESVSVGEIEKGIVELGTFLELSDENIDEVYKSLDLSSDNFCLSNFSLIEKEIRDFTEVVSKLPEISNEDKAKEFLTICQERLSNYWDSKRKYLFQVEKLKIADSMLDSFNLIVESELNSLYEDVQKDFSKFYQIVNQDDESSFDGDLIADKGALDFKVNFYDRGKFPPAAYHSEGHQDGMGLCLYLALMKKILGDRFTLAILDDVLMSVDSDHRKSFCKLLKTEFPNTQFIITTHDEYWKKQMITEGLISHSTALHFKNWTVDTGPTVWDDKDSWAEIDVFLAQENIPSASHTLRRFLEYLMDELSIRLAASIARSASGDHDLGELLSGVTSRYGDLLKKAKTSARSWGNEELETKIKGEKENFDECLKKARNEMWGVNGTVHFNSWISMGRNDFKEIRDAYQALIENFKCSNCNTLLHVIPIKGSSEALKCDCGARSYNLKSKS